MAKGINTPEFQAARTIALTIGNSGKNLRRRAEARKENPFYGANFERLGPIILWYAKDDEYAKALAISHTGRMEMEGQIWHFIKVS